MSILSDLAKYLIKRAAEGTAERAPVAVERAAVRRGTPMAVRTLNVRPVSTPPPPRAASMAVKALPAPPRQLALPKPGPALPAHAAKPKGGQWWPNTRVAGFNDSPEAAAAWTWGAPRQGYQPAPGEEDLRAWWPKALTKYLRNDLGTPDDPMRALAERGMFHIPGIGPEDWDKKVNELLQEDTVGGIMFPHNELGGMPGAGDELRGASVAAMPWLPKLPVHEKIYGIRKGALEDLDLTHIADEMKNALNPASGLPSDLAVRPESLARMSFPQAAEHTARINNWRAQQMLKAGETQFDNPAVVVHKSYPDDPRGMRWVELRQPEDAGALPEGYSTKTNPQGYTYLVRPGGDVLRSPFRDAEEAAQAARYEQLQDALKFEGDTMGHCVGGYCDDVASGRSRIFSLRDAKGQPHVTIETAPKNLVYNDLLTHLGRDEDLANDYLARGYQMNAAGDTSGKSPLGHALDLAGVPRSENIVQIKGKQNRAPNDEYLPYVQDFVKSQPWGEVGDLRNVQLVKLPDGRFLTQAQIDEAFTKNFEGQMGPRRQADLDFLRSGHAGPDDGLWNTYKGIFEGYAYGGRVEADRDFARHPMAVTRRAA